MGAGVIRFGEGSPAQQADAQRLDGIAAQQRNHGQVQPRSLGRNGAFDGDRRALPVAGGRQDRSDANGFYTRQLAEVAERLLIERVDACLGSILIAGQTVERGEAMVGAETYIDRAHFFETAQEQA